MARLSDSDSYSVAESGVHDDPAVYFQNRLPCVNDKRFCEIIIAIVIVAWLAGSAPAPSPAAAAASPLTPKSQTLSQFQCGLLPLLLMLLSHFTLLNLANSQPLTLSFRWRSSQNQ